MYYNEQLVCLAYLSLCFFRDVGLGGGKISKKDKAKQSTNPADFAFNPNGEQEDVGEVQAFHLLLMLLRLVVSLPPHSVSRIRIHVISVADPGCLSRIPDPDPTIFWYAGSGSDRLLSRIRIPDPGPTNKKREK
jgi:hypothetical protein